MRYVLTLFLLFLCVILTPAGAVPIQNSTPSPLLPGSTDSPEWAAALPGQEVTLGELLERINPEYLASLPAEKRDWYFQLNVTIPNRTAGPGSVQYGARAVSVAAIAVPGCPAPSPAESGRYRQCMLDESAAGVIGPLSDAGMTLGEFLEIMCPDYVAALPECHRASLYNESLRSLALSFSGPVPVGSVPHGPVIGIGALAFGFWEIVIFGTGFILVIGIAAYGAYRIIRRYNRP